MKKILRKFIFSAIALYLTSLWNYGFVLTFDLYTFLQTVLIIALAYYLVLPLSKVVLLPLNILTFGMVSFAVFVLFLYILSAHLSFIQINDWVFKGGTYFGIYFNNVIITQTGNLVLSAISISAIIKTLEILT